MMPVHAVVRSSTITPWQSMENRLERCCLRAKPKLSCCNRTRRRIRMSRSTGRRGANTSTSFWCAFYPHSLHLRMCVVSLLGPLDRGVWMDPGPAQQHIRLLGGRIGARMPTSDPVCPQVWKTARLHCCLGPRRGMCCLAVQNALHWRGLQLVSDPGSGR